MGTRTNATGGPSIHLDAATPPSGDAVLAGPALTTPALPVRAIGCALEPRGSTERDAQYALVVRNGGAIPLAASVRGVRADGTTVPAVRDWIVEAATDAIVEVTLPLASGPYVRVTGELRSDELQLVVDAAPPALAAPDRQERAGPLVAAAFAAALLAVGGALGALALRPHVDRVALAASPDGRLAASYAVHGGGRVTYDLRDGRGTVVAAGALNGASGNFTLAPHFDARELRVAVTGPFGGDERVATVERAPAPPPVVVPAPALPHVRALSIAAAGGRTRVAYDVVARRLALSLVAPDGRTFAHVDAAPGRGVAELPAPPATGYQLEALAHIGSQTAVAAIAVPVAEATPPATASPVASPLAVADAATGLVIRPPLLVPGEPFAVTLPVADGAHVAVVRDRDGAELRSLDVGPGQRLVALVAPEQGEPATIRVSLSRGASNETLLRPVRWASVAAHR